MSDGTPLAGHDGLVPTVGQLKYMLPGPEAVRLSFPIANTSDVPFQPKHIFKDTERKDEDEAI